MYKRIMALCFVMSIMMALTACATTKGKVIMSAGKTELPVPTINPSKYSASVGEYVTIYDDTLLAVIALNKNSVDIDETLSIALATEGLSEYPDAYIQILPSELPHLALYAESEYMTIMISDIKYIPYAISTETLSYGGYDIRVFDGYNGEVGYISFVVELDAIATVVAPTLPPLEEGHKFNEDERVVELLYTTLNTNDHPVKTVYQTAFNGTPTLITQYEYKGDIYYSYGPDDDLMVYLIKDGKCYALLSDVKTAVRVDMPAHQDLFTYTDFAYVDSVVANTCVQTLVTTEYSCDDMYKDGSSFYRFFFDTDSTLCYIQLDTKRLVKLLSYEAVEDTSMFEIPEDYSTMDLVG